MEPRVNRNPSGHFDVLLKSVRALYPGYCTCPEAGPVKVSDHGVDLVEFAIDHAKSLFTEPPSIQLLC
jgi:hypothetical protein